MRNVSVGCAGWSITSAYGSLFEEADSALARYASRFSVVEINSSFYRPHQRKTYLRRSKSVPRAFRFSVKLPKAISHDNGLRGIGQHLDDFLEQTSGLGANLGGYLLQLPPSLALDARTASMFLRMFRHRCAARLALEPRHLSWFAPRADELLARYEVSRVRADPAIAHTPISAGMPEAWPYWRLHGSPRMYYSSYSSDALNAVVNSLHTLPASGPSAWVIFDSTAYGHAIPNAILLKKKLK